MTKLFSRLPRFWAHLAGGVAAGLLALASTPAQAQAPTWQAVSTPTSGSTATAYPTIQRSAPDANGNIIIAGSFSGRVSFGNTTLQSAGGTNGFVAKYNPTTDTYVWAERLGGSSGDDLTGLAVNGTSIYVTGTGRSANFTVGTQGSVAGLSSDVYVVKLTDTGTAATYVWSQIAASTSPDTGVAVAVSGNNVYVTGVHSPGATIAFGSLTLPATSSGGEAFVAKILDGGSSSSWLWAKGIVGAPQDIAADASGVYLTGSMYFFGRFDAFSLNTDTTYGYRTDMYVAKLVDNGATAAFAWVQTDGDNHSEAAGHTVTVSNGYVYVGGYTSGTTTFGGYYGGFFNGYVWKLSTAGGSVWRSYVINAGYDTPTGSYGVSDIVVNGADVLLAGNFRGTFATVGGYTVTNTNSATTTYDGYVAKLVDRGSTFAGSWVLGLGAAGDDFANTVSVAGNQVYVSGTVTPPAQFSAITITSSNTTTLGYIASLQATFTPAVTGINPATGGAGTLVTLTGNNLSGATAVTLNGVGIAGFTVNSTGTAITFTLPAGATSGTIGVTVPSGPAVSNVYFTVVYPPTVSSVSPTHGVAGSPLTIAGSSFSGATAVSLGSVALPGFVVNAAGTQITVTLPAGVSSGNLSVTTPTGTDSTPFTVDQPTAGPILLDGYREARYGAPAAVQGVGTGFGNAVNGSQTTALLGSELDAAYTYIHGDSLYVLLTGNLQNNGNAVDVFFDTQAGGQNILAANNPNVDNGGLNAMAGLRFDTGFTADYMLSVKGRQVGGVIDTYFASLGTGGTSQNPASTGTGRVVTMNLGGGRTGTVAIDNSNTGGVDATTAPAGAPNAVVTGIEFVLPLSALGSPAGAMKIAAFLNNGNHDVLSNQVLGTLTPGTSNLGNPVNVNFNNYPGNQYFTATAPATPTQVVSVSPAGGAVGSTITITGAGFTGATSVSFNGTAATYTVTSPTTISVVVPAGATAGLITVTAPGGTASSAGTFCVQYTPTATGAARCGPGSVTLQASGAPAGSTYTWYTAATGGQMVNSSTTGTLLTPALGNNTPYYVAVTTGSGATACEGPRTLATATINQTPLLAVNTSAGLTLCPGSTLTLTASGADSYLWNTGATTASITVTQPGGYSAVGTIAATGCSANTGTTFIGAASVPVASIAASGPTALCPGSSVTLTSASTSGTNLLWSNGATTPSITVTQPGNYTLTATIPGGCSATSAAMAVTQAAAPTASIATSGSTTLCPGSSVVLTANSGASYQWSNGATSQSITVSTPGSYTVTVGNGSCTATSAATTVSQGTTATASIATSGTTTFCQGGSVTLTATGVPGSTYLWSNGATTPVLSVAQAGTYTVTATAPGGCTATSAPVAVVVNAQPIANAGPARSYCSGGAATLGTPAVAGTTYSWSPAIGLNSASAAQPTVTLTNAGVAPTTQTYTLTASNAAGCIATSQVAVTVNGAAQASIFAGGPTAICQGSSVTLTASSAPGNTYLWNNGATTASISATQAGSYTVTVTNAGGCAATSAPTTVSINAAPATPTVTGNTGNLSATSSSPTGNQWYFNNGLIPGATGQTISTATTQQQGLYSVVVTNAAGCASAMSNQVLLVVLGTAPAAFVAQVQVYPNPTTGRFTLALPAARPAQVQVLNALGQVVQTRTATGSVALDLSGLARGVYAVRVQLGEDVVTKRVVLE